MVNKNYIQSLLLYIGIGLLSYFLFGYIDNRNNLNKWYFAGYQYKWSHDYIKKSGFTYEKECVDFGNEWLDKQINSDSLFTCANGCKPYKDTGLLECNMVCEYGKQGFIQCRK